MREYRLYTVNERGEIKEAPKLIWAAADEEALLKAKEQSISGRHELWFGPTMIGNWIV